MSARGAALIAILLATGCAGPRLGAPQPTFGGLQAVRAAGIPAMAVGRFEAGPGLPRGRNQAILIRGAALRPPEGSSYADYLGETLRATLASAGRLDPASDIVLSGLLTRNSVDSGPGQGGGTVAATFIVTRAGRETWRKELQVERAWDSSVLGAVAYIRADSYYGSLYEMLVERLLADPDFRQALRPPA